MRILLVDPGRTALKIVTRLLEAGDHEVRGFTDEMEALDYLGRDSEVDALLTSVELGRMSGLELCWQARIVTGDRRPLYIIVMSSNYERGHLIEALDSGADDFIGKPPVVEELYARLRAASRVVGMQRDLIRLASTDPLTGSLNRRAFFRLAGEACERAATGPLPLAAVMMDIDHFKKINDVYGHDVGDLVLRGVAEQAQKVDGSVFGRLGGEEFAMMLEGRNAQQGLVVADGLRVLMTQLSFPSSKGDVSLTCSFGVTEYHPGDAIDLMLKRADVALYEAKTGGRNRVIVSEDLDAVERPGGIIRGGSRSGDIEAAAE
ncbi:diguanylate cyclase response regulator [Terrihabitans soli]|uniref:diguanylate cyclase n=1 Tax=Terrihabitans soli TaxID=708113 RepID=A0A6S6QNH2_9HYPH|nr:diguanylate cyclase [Terrihabitans soli]BCJ89355.1 diguanylate cyclase response regulator [Terrihabitans soli]